VVDVDGLAKEAQVVTAQPEGVFEEAAFKAIERYKFKPAVKGGKTVTCIVKLPIAFQLR
jgi:protein TonB